MRFYHVENITSVQLRPHSVRICAVAALKKARAINTLKTVLAKI